MELLDRNSCIRSQYDPNSFVHPFRLPSFFPSFPPSFLLNINSLVLEVRDDKRATGTGSCLSRHPFLPVLQCTETCLPSIPQSCRALPGLQVFALVVSTASKAEFAPRPHEAAFIILFSSQPRWPPLSKVPPTQPTPKRNLYGSPFIIAPCCPVFITFYSMEKTLMLGEIGGRRRRG